MWRDKEALHSGEDVLVRASSTGKLVSASSATLPPEDVESLIGVYDPTDKAGVRDRATLLLLARLGLRAGDVASLRIADISWPQATIRVNGYGLREALLPLHQDVGDAILLLRIHNGSKPRKLSY